MLVISRNERRMVSRYENLDTTQPYSGGGACERSSRMREQQTILTHTLTHSLRWIHTDTHSFSNHAITQKDWNMHRHPHLQTHKHRNTQTFTLRYRYTHSDTDTLTPSVQDWSVEVYCAQCLQVQYSLFHLCGLIQFRAVTHLCIVPTVSEYLAPIHF